MWQVQLQYMSALCSPVFLVVLACLMVDSSAASDVFQLTSVSLEL